MSRQDQNKKKEIDYICQEKLRQFLCYIYLTIRYQDVVQPIKTITYKAKKYIREKFIDKGDQPIENYQLKTPTSYVNTELVSLPFTVPDVSKELFQMARTRYGVLKFSSEIEVTELPVKKILYAKALVRGYYIFIYEGSDITKSGMLINGSIELNQEFFTLNRLNNQMGIVVYKRTQIGLLWQSFFLNLIGLKAYYFIVAQGRGQILKSVVDFFEQEKCSSFQVSFKNLRVRQLIEITSKSFQIGQYIINQFLQNSLNLLEQKETSQICIAHLPECIKINYRLPIQQFTNIRKLVLINAINKSHLKALQTYLWQDKSDQLQHLDISQNQLRGGIGKLFEVMRQKFTAELKEKQWRREHMLQYYGLAQTMLDDSDLNKIIQSFDRVNKKLFSAHNFKYSQRCTIDLSRNNFQPKKLTFISSFISNYEGIQRLILRGVGCGINKIFFEGMSKNVGIKSLDLRDNQIESQDELDKMLMTNISLEQLLISKTDDYSEELLPYFKFEYI